MSLLAILILVLCLLTPAWAARSLSADQPIALRLEPFQPTALTLPEPVASVSVGMAAERISLDYDGPYVFLLPLDPTVTGRLFVVGHSGKLYTVLFKVATPADDVVHVTATAAHQASAKPQAFAVPSLLRALRTGAEIPGLHAVDLPAPTITDTRISLVGSSAVALGTTLGLVVTLRNTQPTPLALDLRIGAALDVPADGVVALSTWTWPPRLTIRAVATDAEIVEPAQQTRVYVVLERRP